MKKILKNTVLVLLALLLLAACAVGIEYFGGQPMGLFSGSRPTGLGITDGKFKPPSWKPNTVSSMVAKDDSHYIEPLKFDGAPDVAWKKLTALIHANKRAKVIIGSPDYLYAEYKSAGMGFVDDVEFALDMRNSAIQVRSSARLGVRDFGVNRKRVETIREAFNAK